MGSNASGKEDRTLRCCLHLRRRAMILLLVAVVAALMACLCVQFSLVHIDNGSMYTVVRWIDVPYKENNSLYDRIVEMTMSTEARAFRDVVNSYSPEHWEVLFSRSGIVKLYSVFANDWRDCGATDTPGGWVDTPDVWVSLFTGQILVTGSLEECFAWDGTATTYCKVTAQRHLRSAGLAANQVFVQQCAGDDCMSAALGANDVLAIFDKHGLFVSVQQCARDDCRSAALGANDVIVIFDKRGLFVRTPCSFVFRGYKWKMSMFNAALVKHADETITADASKIPFPCWRSDQRAFWVTRVIDPPDWGATWKFPDKGDGWEYETEGKGWDHNLD